ncbi:Protein of unknown function [Paenibacillus sp. UNCCL117]|uniref:DUF4227 family protein n=1 Tax=unclassified Paenibacillus TaxID=185978 RepID=UPI00088B2847|nr:MULTISPECIES: DUF4227 family protein [unclassified Paenibacillus]SDC37951.1 Protein of unknown function [Paenibacillus sp. cl123]SFW14564.1 Protein of unknown function [Paenibacillus sp. UNCCL117]
MIIHIRAGRWLARLRFALVFVVCTFALYHLLIVAASFLEPVHRYKEPSGRAIKVFKQDSAIVANPQGMGDRLRLFYKIGE